jgi:hypothetical protein
MAAKRFTRSVLSALDEGKYVYIRSGDHRFIAVWPVVVRDRLFVRSWNDKPTGWHRAFLDNPDGAIRVGDREVRVRARPVRGDGLNDAIDQAYRDKFTTKANLKYVRGLASARRRGTTTELVPR